MLKQERLYRIASMVREKPFITIQELTDQLQISRSSVMRDLNELEQEGVISRERGGAVRKDISETTLSSFSETPVASRQTVNENAKRRIAAEAALHIKDGDCIFLDGGTSPAFLIPLIASRKIQIVTPSTYLSRQIPNTFPGEVVLLGGRYLPEFDTVSGSYALEMIDHFNFDRAYLGTNGISLAEHEATIFAPEIGALKSRAMKRSLQTCLLADAAKFNVRAMCVWAKLEDFDVIYTDSFPTGRKKPENVKVCAVKGEKKNENNR